MIEVSHVFKKYDGNDYYSVRDLSFTVDDNMACGLLGHNGSGKSTMMKMLSTLYKPDKGSITVNDYDTVKNQDQIKKIIGISFEEPRLYHQLTGEENILYYSDLFGMDRKTAKSRLQTMYEDLEVDFQDQIMQTYSKGMAQKISLIRALITNPKVILLDEPTSGLDIVARNQIRKYIARLKEYGKTIIITSHISEDIELLCDKVVIINKGLLIEDSDINSLKSKYGTSNFEDTYISIQNAVKERSLNCGDV